jgi:hypothetical protein
MTPAWLRKLLKFIPNAKPDSVHSCLNITELLIGHVNIILSKATASFVVIKTDNYSRPVSGIDLGLRLGLKVKNRPGLGLELLASDLWPRPHDLEANYKS